MTFYTKFFVDKNLVQKMEKILASYGLFGMLRIILYCHFLSNNIYR